MAFEREDSNVIGEGVHQRLAVYEKQFCAAETDKRMKGMAFRAFYVLARTLVVEEIKRCKGTSTAEHLKIVLSVIDRARRRNVAFRRPGRSRLATDHTCVTSDARHMADAGTCANFLRSGIGALHRSPTSGRVLKWPRYSPVPRPQNAGATPELSAAKIKAEHGPTCGPHPAPGPPPPQT